MPNFGQVAELNRRALANAGSTDQADAQARAADPTAPQSSWTDVWTHTGSGIKNRAQNPTWREIPVVGSLAGVGRGLGGEWASSDFGDAGSSIASQAGSFAHQAGLLFGTSKPGPGEVAPEGALQTVGAVFGLLTSMEQMLSTALSVIPFPALPAVRIGDLDVGLPHAHAHPPNLIPPAPPVPLPSTGPLIPIPFLSGAAKVLINGMPAARCGDLGLGIWCGGYVPMYEIFLGSSSVWIEGARAARVGVDITKHCIFTTPKPSDPPIGPMVGATICSSPNVSIGGVPMPSLLNMAMGKALKGLFGAAGRAIQKVRAARAAQKAAQRIGQEINPTNCMFNCGHNIDAALDRLYGRNPHAVAPIAQDGSFVDIGNRHGVPLQWGNTMADAFNAVDRGGPGTTAIVGIDYGVDAMGRSRGSHVVVMTNVHGKPTIIEGQNWGPGQPAGAITDQAAATSRYPGDIGIAVLPNRAPPL